MIRFVLVRLSKWLVVLTLILTLGAHWVFLQSVAWLGMVVAYSQDASFSQAVSKTFDGQHPCCLCKFVRQGKAAEKKQESQKPDTKLDPSLPSARGFVASPPNFVLTFSRFVDASASHGEAPPVPPPRSLPT